MWYNILVRMRGDQVLREAWAILNPRKNSGRDGGGTGARGQASRPKGKARGEQGNPFEP